MSGIFTVTALAIAAERANAIGVVRLTCFPEGLEIELVRAAGFTEGFAPSSVAEQVSFTVPYAAVRGLVRHGRTLGLALDPAVAAPHNRFALVRFTDDPAEALASTYRARLAARWISYLLPVPLGALAAALAPSGLVSGSLGTASLAALVALAAFLALRGLVRWLTWGGPVSDQYRDALETELSRRLGLAPARPLVTSPWDTPIPTDVAEPPGAIAGPNGGRGRPPLLLGALAPRLPPPSPPTFLASPRTWALLAALTLGLVGAMAFLKRYAAPRDARLPSFERAAGLGTAARAMARIEIPPPGSDRPRCACQRADSLLWKDGIPVLSVLLAAQPDDGSGVVAPVFRKGKKPRYDFDLAVVNNGEVPLRDISIILTFARRDEQDQRIGVTDRGLFWGRVLSPGRAVKWRVRAPGTEMQVNTNTSGSLNDTSALPAPPDAFFDLLSSRFRVVRIHGAMMLAYLRDPRALDAVRALGAAAPSEVETLARIQRASASLIACDVKAEEGLLTACVFNAEARPASGLALREVAEKGGPGERAFSIEGAIPVHEGARVSFPLEGGSAPAEVLIERAPIAKPAAITAPDAPDVTDAPDAASDDAGSAEGIERAP